jgi:hypothetical protein
MISWQSNIHTAAPRANSASYVLYSLTQISKPSCSNFRSISLLSTSYRILSNILLARLTPYAEEIIGDHQCGYRLNRSMTIQIFYIRQILEKKWEFNGTVLQLYIDFNKAYIQLEGKYYTILSMSLEYPGN